RNGAATHDGGSAKRRRGHYQPRALFGGIALRRQSRWGAGGSGKGQRPDRAEDPRDRQCPQGSVAAGAHAGAGDLLHHRDRPGDSRPALSGRRAGAGLRVPAQNLAGGSGSQAGDPRSGAGAGGYGVRSEGQARRQLINEQAQFRRLITQCFMVGNENHGSEMCMSIWLSDTYNFVPLMLGAIATVCGFPKLPGNDPNCIPHDPAVPTTVLTTAAGVILRMVPLLPPSAIYKLLSVSIAIP